VLSKEGTGGPSNIAVEMSSSTIAATPRFVLRRQGSSLAPAAGWRYAGAAGGEDRFSSPAGLHTRPWFERLRHALREDRFVLHYQPIVALDSGEVSHYEALVRLADGPGGELVAPGCFLPAAERYGLVREIDRLVVGRVAALLGAALPPADRSERLRVAVNLSALSVTDRGMLSHIERELNRHRVDPRRLVLEITETAAISDMPRAQAFCAGVQALGCAIALDDFGVGFGSFYYAKRLPFRYLKIDGDFVRGLRSSHEDRLMVKAIADVARGMGRQTIAEFVGDAPTMELLGELGVDYAQGFQVGRPRPSVAV
jgi:EAL domain-containing protein (putative c-di-GMP-specific phosphodiesterase class I)